MKRINKLFKDKKNILSVFFTAGYPNLNSTKTVISGLQKKGVNMIEIGMPFSDPVADGETIQQSSKIALKNGMTIKLLFQQLENIRNEINIPLILMGYINPIYKFGFNNFLKKCKETGIDALIIPDLPLEVYEKEHKGLFEKYGISNIFLVTPETDEKRIRLIDSITNSFIYVVSSASITGIKNNDSKAQTSYFQKLKNMNLKSPYLIGFGIKNNIDFNKACENSNGAIIGSEFIKQINPDCIDQSIDEFVNNILL